MYSYDATHGPGSGTDVLSNAITKAVQRYENKVTEKLAKEYEFVDNTKELADGYTTDADEDDFEIIDVTNLETHDARTLYVRWTVDSDRRRLGMEFEVVQSCIITTPP
jgi:urate oxidase